MGEPAVEETRRLHHVDSGAEYPLSHCHPSLLLLGYALSPACQQEDLNRVSSGSARLGTFLPCASQEHDNGTSPRELEETQLEEAAILIETMLKFDAAGVKSCLPGAP